MRYRCTLSATGLPDYHPGMRSFQIRLQQAPATCYVSCVLPVGSSADIEAALAYSHGTLKITQIDGAGNETDVITVDVDIPRVDEGAVNRSVTMIGYRAITFSTADAHTLTHALYNGTYQVRTLPVAGVEPGDSVTVAGQTFVVDRVAWTVSESRQTMELIP